MTSGKRRKWPWVLLFGAIVVVALFYLAGGWYFSGLVHQDALEAVPYDPADLQGGTIQDVDIDQGTGTIVLAPDEEYLDETKFDDAVVGLAVGESLVVVGPATVGADGTESRAVLEIDGDPPAPGDRYGLSRDVWLSPEQAGMEFDDVTLTTLEGLQIPAWVIPGDDPGKWAVLTHGKGAARSEMLRMARPLHKAGYNLLVITYRGDVGAPPYEEGMVTFGRVEWQELEAAVQYARDQGADTIVLGGVSHGGAVALGFLDRGSLVRDIDGIILDSPASSFEDVIDEAAEYRSLPIGGLPIPESLEDVAKLFVAFRYGVDYSAIDYSGMDGLIEVPLLVFQGAADETVPKPVNDRLMRGGAGDGGEYVVVEGADHVLSWNYGPEAYDEKVTEFVEGLGAATE
jgi:hypothetical protein